MTKRLMLLADEYASAYKNNLATHPLVERSRDALESALEDELSKLRGLIAGRSAEYLAAHITYDKRYQEGRLDAEVALKPVAEIGVSVFTWLGDRPPAGTTLYRIEQP